MRVEMMRRTAALLIALVLPSCKANFPTRNMVAGESFSAAELRWCERLGGQIEQVGFVASTCVYPSNDSGKACHDSEDCVGRCEAPAGTEAGVTATGTCSAMVGRIGCANVLIDGKATGMLCAD